MKQGITIVERTVSGFPLSIGTGLAFETLFTPTQAVYDPERKSAPKVNLADYDTFWINLTTLFRNIYTAVPKEYLAITKPEDFYTTLLEEIDTIVSLVDASTAGTKVQFYYSDYSDLERESLMNRLKLINLRLPKTDKQKAQYKTMNYVIEAVVKLHGEHIKFSDAIKPSRSDKSIVLTHQPYDLTRHTLFNELSLIESNTGVIKQKHQLNSKYYPIPGVDPGVGGMGSLPFNRKLLMVFGDRHLIVPMPLVLRNKILETAKARHWLPSSTIDKINLDLSIDFLDPFTMAAWKTF